MPETHAHGGAREASATSRFRVGRHEVLALSDGYIDSDPELLGPPEHPTAGHEALRDESGSFFIPIGCFLLPGPPTVLIDLGLGPADRSAWPIDLVGGRLIQELRGLGFEPGDIDVIALSHLHLDHVGWLGGLDGEPMFPNADVHLGAADWDYFVDGTPEIPLDEPVRTALQTTAERGRLHLLDSERQIVPGLTRLAAPGHTPGHSIFAIHDGRERAMLLGDAVYCPLQLTETDWLIGSDVDKELGRRTRELYLRALEREGGLGIGCHFPGLRAGRVLAGAWMEEDSGRS